MDVGAGKPSVNSANLETMEDPKPGDLPMSRVNPVEIREKARTDVCCNKLG